MSTVRVSKSATYARGVMVFCLTVLVGAFYFWPSIPREQPANRVTPEYTPTTTEPAPITPTVKTPIYYVDATTGAWVCHDACPEDSVSDWACEFVGNKVCSDRRRGPS